MIVIGSELGEPMFGQQWYRQSLKVELTLK
jgi:hypothetical protein